MKLIEQLGIKVYFDESEKPYTYSHELAEIINKKTSETNRAIRNLLDNIHQCNFAPMSEGTEFTMVEDTYEDIRGNGAKVKTTTYKLYKDLLFMYVLGLTGQSVIEFKMKYIDAFNYIEKEHNKLLIENGLLKESFLNMYNEVRKRNRDLLILDNNKKCSKKKAS